MFYNVLICLCTAQHGLYSLYTLIWKVLAIYRKFNVLASWSMADILWEDNAKIRFL